jgi:hypothetical protein
MIAVVGIAIVAHHHGLARHRSDAPQLDTAHEQGR